MGFFRKKKTAIMPFKKMSKQDIEDRRISMQSELDEIDFKAAKTEREARLKRAKSEKRRQTIKDIHRNVDAALDIFDDSALKGTSSKKKKGDIDPFGTPLAF